MKNWIWYMTAALALVLVLGGCGTYKKDGVKPNAVRPNNVNDGMILKDKRFANDQSNEMNHINGVQQKGNNLIGNHKNYRIEMSQDISNHLTKIEGIKSSYVMLTNNNAYVAVSFEDHNIPMNNNNKMEGRTNLGQMGKNAVDTHRKMGVMNTGEDRVTDQVKARVAEVVKKYYPNADHVYVSANPDFVGRMKGYATDISLGHPIQGFITEFNAMVDRVFPAVHGTDASHNRGFSTNGGRLLE